MIVPDPDFRPNPDRAIYVHGPIDDRLVYQLTPEIVNLQSESRSPITIYVDSPGGDIASKESLWRLLKASNQDFADPCRVITVVTSRAASAAADLLSSGDYAIAHPHSTILYHGVRTSRDIPWTAEMTSVLASLLRSVNETYAMQLMRKIEFRFMFRFLVLRRQFAAVREKDPKRQISDTECFQAIISDSISEQASKLFKTATDRQGRYDTLLDVAKRAETYPTIAETEASRLKAMVDYEVQRNREDPNWTFQGGGLVRLNDDFFLLNEHLTPSEGDRFDRWCIDWGRFALGPADQEELKQIPEESRNEKLIQKVRPQLEPLWSFFIALCHTLQEGENELTATDAFYLGLIDEVMGVEDLQGSRQIIEYKADPPESEPPQVQTEESEQADQKA